MTSTHKYDAFICHASEDKEAVALPLANLLIAGDAKVWYDKFSLKIGDSLRQRIDEGLKESRFGVVIISKNFFKKKWTRDELDGLLAMETPRRKVILPVWHEVTKAYVKRFSPILAGRLAARTSDGMDAVAEAILKEIRREKSLRSVEKPVSIGKIVTSQASPRTIDDRVRMMDKSYAQYLTITKKGPYEHLSECPLFLPDFYVAPQFGETRGALRTDAEIWESVGHLDFKRRIDNVMSSIASLGNYLGGSQDLFWSISDTGKVYCGYGTNTLAKALDDGQMGMIYAAICGRFFSTSQNSTYIAVMSGYCKSRDNGKSWIQDPAMTLFQSLMPTNPAWIHKIMQPFVEKQSTPETLAYELFEAQSREWLPSSNEEGPHKVIGTIGSVKHKDVDFSGVAGTVVLNDWFSDAAYEVFRDWHRGIELGQRAFPAHPIWGGHDDDCPLLHMDKSIISLTGRATLEDYESGNIVGFLPPHVRTFEAPISGADLYIIGIEAPGVLRNEL